MGSPKLAPVAENKIDNELLAHAGLEETTQGAQLPAADPINNRVNKQVQGAEDNQADGRGCATLRGEILAKEPTREKRSTDTPAYQQLLDTMAQVIGGQMAGGATKPSTAEA